MIDLDFEEYLTLELTKLLFELGVKFPAIESSALMCPHWYLMKCNPSDLAEQIIRGGKIDINYRDHYDNTSSEPSKKSDLDTPETVNHLQK